MRELHLASTLIENPSLHKLRVQTGKPLQVVIVGHGGIGAAMLAHLLADDAIAKIHVLSSQDLTNTTSSSKDPAKLTSHQLDITEVAALEQVAKTIAKPIDVVIVTTGLLHSKNIAPEKRLQDIAVDALQRNYLVNAIVPMLCAQVFLPKFSRHQMGVFAALSARVGSITDNRLGGWYGYRASKAALNMHLKTLSIEMHRTHKQLKVFGLHPGTVSTDLSSPFQANVPEGKLFTPSQSAGYLINVLAHAAQYASGQVIDWAGKVIEP